MTERRHDAHTPHSVSHIVAALCDGPPDDMLSVRDLLHAFGERASGLLILVFALPNGIPAPLAPGMSAILGLPLLLLSGQMLLGYREPWIPASWGARRFRRSQIAAALRPSLPYLRWLEQWIRPRFTFFARRNAVRLLGALMLWNALVLSLPIPLANLLPAWALILGALGQIERDGALVMVSGLVGLAGTIWAGFLIWGGASLLEKLFA